MSAIINQLKRAATTTTVQQNDSQGTTTMQCSSSSSSSSQPSDSASMSGVMEMRFSLEPQMMMMQRVSGGSSSSSSSSSGYSQWHSAMMMVTQLPEGIPIEFRRRMWLSLADKHLDAKNIDWTRVQGECFSEWSHPADAELGVQIVKDLHRTGCSLFCGKDGQQNQALLKRVLLAYARWNKIVGYCQGFNMLAALILQVTEKNESDALKLMIYLIEGVLPDSYFADSLRGLSVDMAVFRDLLRTKLPKLSRHLDKLQSTTKDGSTSYEPPLTNVFTMQWFLTLFCNCLPQPTVLRVWDLIMLEGNDVLLRTALAIWQTLADRIMTARSADEFYSVMGVLMRQVLDDDLISANTLINKIVQIGPLKELRSLREHYLYNINPWSPKVTKRQTVLDRRPQRPTGKRKVDTQKDKMLLDIGILKKQYAKLKQRQRQAHVIFNSAVNSASSRQSTKTKRPPMAVNHLLLGKSALVPAKKAPGPPKGTIPPVIIPSRPPNKSKDSNLEERKKKFIKQSVISSSSSSSSSSDTELCDDPNNDIDEDLDALDLVALELDPDTIKLDNPVDDDQRKQKQQQYSDRLNLDLDENKVPDLLTFEAKDIFDVSSNGDLDFVEKVERSNSLPSDDGFDFENFLKERVSSCSKASSEESLSEESGSNQTRNARRSSVRALEIIQENSLILHRILQCQSRLTPTPPPLLTTEDDDDDDNDVEKSTREEEKEETAKEEEKEEAIGEKEKEEAAKEKEKEEAIGEKEKEEAATSVLDFLDLPNINQLKLTPSDNEEDISDTCSSNLVMDVSKSTSDSRKILLEENYDLLKTFASKKSEDLIPISRRLFDEEGKEEKEEKQLSQISQRSLIEIDKNSKYNSIIEYSRDLDEKFNNLIVKGKPTLTSNYSLDLPSKVLRDDERKPKPSRSYTDFHQSDQEPLVEEDVEMERNDKVTDKESPQRGPFPVSISSRQNKDVAIRLGLYKK